MTIFLLLISRYLPSPLSLGVIPSCRKVDHIWHAPWTPPKVVFLLNRYGALIGQSFILLEELGILSHGSRKVLVFSLMPVRLPSFNVPQFCANFQWFQAILTFFSSEATRSESMDSTSNHALTNIVLLLLRSWALWKCSHRVAVSLVFAYVSYVLVLGGFVSYIMFKYGLGA